MVEELQLFLNFLKQIDNNFYINNTCQFSGTIGQHCRHIIEFYECFFVGFNNKKINYDLRKRDYSYETNIDIMIEKTQNLINALENFEIDNSTIEITNNYNTCLSSMMREIMFLSEHTVHHMAIIRIISEKNGFEFNEEIKQFGFSISTQKYMSQNSK